MAVPLAIISDDSTSDNDNDPNPFFGRTIDVIKRLVAKYTKYLKFVTSADGIMEAFGEKRIGSLIAVEGGHSRDSRLAVLRMIYELGVRYMTLMHACSTTWADASPVDEDGNAVVKNMTEWGKNVIWEMNRLGMLVDISHVSHGVMGDVLAHMKAPVIFSHSSSHKVYAHHRNVQDDVLKMLIENRGIIMVNFYTGFIGGKSIDDVVRKSSQFKSVTGPDHIGIGGDSTPDGLDDFSKYPDLFDILANVFREVEQVRDSMSDVLPYEDLISYQDFVDVGVEVQPCITDVEIH
ncbi:hypothetical protein quinque_007173 [Culex quinquefasciatus]